MMSRERRILSRSQAGLLACLGAVLAMVLVAWLLIAPMRGRAIALQKEVDAGVARNDQALDRIRRISALEHEVAALESSLALETNQYVLRPVLGSYPVQRDLYRLAAETSFKIALIREVGAKETPTAIKAPAGRGAARPAARTAKATPPSAFARYTVEVAGEGTYADVYALIERLEQENPYCAVTDLSIRGLPASPERHRVTLTLEWPVLAPPPEAAPPARR